MVTRTYDPLQFNMQDRRQVTGSEISRADTSVKVPQQIGDGTWRDRMFEQMGNQWANTLNKAADIEFNSLYLEGAAQAGIVKSEEELQADPMTRDWKVAGYRDTMGKLALADAEAQFAADIPTLREKGPEEFQQYLTERRSKLLPAITGASREARATMAGQMLLQDRASTSKWTAEHAKFIVEQKSQAVFTQMGVQFNSMKQLQLQSLTSETSAAAYQDQLRSAAGTIYGSVWNDASLNIGHRQEITFGVLQQALSQDNVQMYDYLRDTQMPGADGNTSTLLSRLTGDQQVKLANQYRETMARTADARNLYRMEQIANIEAQIQSNTYNDTYENLNTSLSEMVLNKTITGERRASILQNYNVSQMKRQQNSTIGEALIRGDMQAIYGAGKDVTQAADALEATLNISKATPTQRLNTWLQVGLNSNPVGFKKAGEQLATSLRQMRAPDGTMLPQHVETFRQINSALRDAESRGQDNTRVMLLSGLGEADRMFAERIMNSVDAGATYEEATRRATDAETKEAGLSPAVKAARSATTASEVTKEIEKMDAHGAMGGLWNGVKSIVSSDAAATNVITPYSGMNSRDGWFSDSPTVKFYAQRSRDELAAEASYVLTMNPGSSASEVLSVSKANLASRTIQTENGPIFMPRNTNIGQVFGVGSGNVPAIGPAIDGMLKNTKEDTRWQLAFTQGRLFAQEFNKNGERVGNGMFLNPADVRAKIKEQTDGEAAKANAIFGGGNTVNLPEGAGKITYNGVNTAGVPNEWMYNYRTNLVNHEGVATKAYKDLSGKVGSDGKPIMTVGIGVSSHNPHYPKPRADGTYDPNALRRSFLGASEDAALTGARVAKNLGRYNEPGFKLMSELAYQSGTNFIGQKNQTGEAYREFGAKLRGDDVQAAQEAFKRTAAWSYSADKKNPGSVTRRQQSYLKLIEQSMKG